MATTLSPHQVRALGDARTGLLYRTPAGWRRRGGRLHRPGTVEALVARRLAFHFLTQRGQLAAILTATGLATADALRRAGA